MKNMEWHGPQVIASVNRELPNAVKRACLIVEGDAISGCPVKTGNLKSSLTHTVDGNEGKVGTNVEYSPYVEFGTYKMAAQPYLRPAADNNRARVQRELGVTIGRAAEAGGKR